MRNLTIFLLLAATLPAFAQEETLLDMKNIEHGGYGAVVVKYATINDEFAVLVGGRGGWIINHTFAIGGGGYGLVNNVHSRIVGPWGERFVSLGYGGLDLELILQSDELVHISVHSLIGAGGVGFRNSWDNNWADNQYSSDHHSESFFVVEPGVNVDLNVTSWLRASAGMEYRYVSGVASGASKSNDLTGPSALLTFRFGKF